MTKSITGPKKLDRGMAYCARPPVNSQLSYKAGPTKLTSVKRLSRTSTPESWCKKTKSMTSPRKLDPRSWPTLKDGSRKLGTQEAGTWEAGVSGIPPRKLGVGVVIAPKKLEEVAYSPQKAGSPRKLPSQAPKDGFHYMLKWMANNKTPACDGISADFYKVGGPGDFLNLIFLYHS